MSLDLTIRSVILDMRERFEMGRQFKSWLLSNVDFSRMGYITSSSSYMTS